MASEDCLHFPEEQRITAPEIAADNAVTFEPSRAEGKKRRRVNACRHALIVKGINQNEVVRFSSGLLQKFETISAVQGYPVIFRQAEVPPGKGKNMLRMVNAIDPAVGKMVGKKAHQRTRSNANDENIPRFRLQQKARHHVLGIGKDKGVRGGQGHPALQVSGSEIQGTVVAVVPYFQ